MNAPNQMTNFAELLFMYVTMPQQNVCHFLYVEYNINGLANILASHLVQRTMIVGTVYL